jgi:hypothetical protein
VSLLLQLFALPRPLKSATNKKSPRGVKPFGLEISVASDARAGHPEFIQWMDVVRGQDA